MKYEKLLALFLISSLFGCTYGHRRIQQTEREIEQAYQDGQISKKEYLQMRIDFEKARTGGSE